MDTEDFAKRRLIILASVCLALAIPLTKPQAGHAIPAAYPPAVWAKQHSGTLAWLYSVYFLNDSTGWAAGSKGTLLSTRDGGQNWRVEQRPTDDALRDVYFSDARNGWLVCERNIYQLRTREEPRTYLMKTSNGGATWRRVNVIGSDVDAQLLKVVFKGNGSGYAFGEAGVLYATRDNGESWSRQVLPTNHLLLGGSFIEREEGWLVGAGATILQTSDAGETWRKISDPRMAGVRFNSVSFVDRSHGWVAGSGGRIFSTSDAGKTWRVSDTGISTDLLDVKFVDGREGWAVGNDGIVIHTIDGGANWVTEQSFTTHPLERLYLTDREHGWAVGFGGAIVAFGNR
jgi:photosystem II stability/assembly factor-like uncharacterized protein